MKRAVFLDRDGTIIELVHHLVDPADVRLIDGAARALERLRAAGYLCVVVTNQSVIGRGMLDEPGLERVHAAMNALLAESGAAVDGIYHCPDAPLGSDPTVIETRDRKPGPGMLERAAASLSIDLSESWMVGDTASDLLAGRNAGCRGSILVRTGYGHEWVAKSEYYDAVADDIGSAATQILSEQEKAAT